MSDGLQNSEAFVTCKFILVGLLTDGWVDRLFCRADFCIDWIEVWSFFVYKMCLILSDLKQWRQLCVTVSFILDQVGGAKMAV